MKYDLEINKIVREIKSAKAKKVLLQFPDGLKPFATKIASEIKNRTNAEILIWFGSNYGACDIPQGKFDLVVNFGH